MIGSLLMKIKSSVLLLAALIGILSFTLTRTYMANARGGTPNPVSNLTNENFTLLIEDVRASSAHRYDAKDNQGNGLDTIKVIKITSGQYVGVYHTLVGGNFVVKVAESIDLINWQFKKDLEAGASNPELYQTPQGDFLVAYEKKSGPDSFIRIRQYKDYTALKQANHMSTKDLSRTLSTTNEGTPNFISINKKPINKGKQDWSGSSITLGFHYLDGTDKNATGTLTNFSSWTSQENTAVNSYFTSLGFGGNIGDRDRVSFPTSSGTKDFTIYEGQSFENRWESWRSALYNAGTNTFSLLDPYTHGRSIAFGNPTVSYLKLPSGQNGFFVSYYIFTEGAVAGEAGQLIFYTSEANLPNVTSVANRDPVNYDHFTAACACNTPGGSAPNNDFFCSDGEYRYCGAAEYCTDYAIQPAWPCSAL